MFLFPDPWEGRLSQENPRGVSGGTCPRVLCCVFSGQVWAANPPSPFRTPQPAAPSPTHVLPLPAPSPQAARGTPPFVGLSFWKSPAVFPPPSDPSFSSPCSVPVAWARRSKLPVSMGTEAASPNICLHKQQRGHRKCLFMWGLLGLPVSLPSWPGGATANSKQASWFLNCFSGPLLGLGRKNKGPVGAASV